ncbi:hypothetical protein [Kingella potus]|uniref:hypothetical protein n=1 Tax=Kingella potus TaxID=265175 RepID=UPI001FD2B2C6|nr:hypothetical protein [Kingella potus]UOP01364.1 hypothetical protein LVJ84_03765 [Kingella potus]
MRPRGFLNFPPPCRPTHNIPNRVRGRATHPAQMQRPSENHAKQIFRRPYF